MPEMFHERLKAPIPKVELERRTAELQKAMKLHNIDCIVAQNITQYMGGCNRWLTDTTAENNYPQSSILPSDGEVRYIACSGPPLDLYPPSHLLRIGKPYGAAPYFSVFNFTNDWEGRFVVQWAKENNAKKIGIAGMEMFHWNYYDYIAKNLDGVEIVDVSYLFDEIRAIKSEDERKAIEKSASMQDKVMGYVGSIAQAGVREYEIRSKIMQLITDLGGEEMIVIMGSAARGERFELMPSFYQNRTLQKGDALYVKLACSGPGGLFTTVGRMFSIGCKASPQMEADWNAALDAQEKLKGMLQVGMEPQVIFAQYNEYLGQNGYEKELGMFAYGQGYDHIERPSIQPGETMKLNSNMCLAVNTSLISGTRTAYCADSFILKPTGPQNLHKTPQRIVRT